MTEKPKKRIRVQSMVFREKKPLFAYGNTGSHGYRHSFIGGAIENGESAERAVLRELHEEACVEGIIFFRIAEPDRDDHITFLVDIGDQVPRLGENPEEKETEIDQRHLQKIMWLDLAEPENFTTIDRVAFARLISECENRRYAPDWLNALKKIISSS